MLKDKRIIKIITPPTASSDIELDLVKLTEYLSKKYDLYGGYGLGGENGYGVEFENDTFMMHPFCWCDREDCDWCLMGSKKTEKHLLKKYGDKDFAEMCYAPNFWYKLSNLQIVWYKWIGRDTRYNRKVGSAEWKKIYKECLKSLLIPPKE